MTGDRGQRYWQAELSDCGMGEHGRKILEKEINRGELCAWCIEQRADDRG
jgi:hypothetical protein